MVRFQIKYIFKELFMIKKCVVLFLAINISSLYAILGGIGLNFAQDSFTMDGESFNYAFLDEEVSITRDEIAPPVGGGGFVYLTLIPFVDFEAGFNITVSPYNYEYQNTLTPDDNDTIKLGLAKFSWYLSAQRPIFKVPTIRVYAGGGINGSTYTKIISYETLTDGDIDTDRLDDLDYIKEELGVSTTGAHIELGARFKPPIFPFSLNANARYNFIKDLVPDEDGFLTISVGLAFAI